MKVIIIDDDQPSIEQLTKKLEQYDNITLAGTAMNGTQGALLVSKEQPDLLFLDVELPDLSGIDFLDRMKSNLNAPCKVVIYTAHSSYMLQAFRSRAFDFLMKPIDDEELAKIIQRACLDNDDASNVTITRKDNEKVLLYVNANDFRVVNISDIALFQFNHNLRVWEVLVAHRDQPIRLKRSANNDTLVSIDSRFVQVNQRYIININYLMEVNNGVCQLYPPFDHLDYVKIGRTFRKQLTERFNAL